MIRQNLASRGDQKGGEMEILPYAVMDTESLMRFYATLFRILVVMYGGGLVAALACILWLLRYDEMPLWVRPHPGPRG